MCTNNIITIDKGCNNKINITGQEIKESKQAIYDKQNIYSCIKLKANRTVQNGKR